MLGNYFSNNTHRSEQHQQQKNKIKQLLRLPENTNSSGKREERKKIVLEVCK